MGLRYAAAVYALSAVVDALIWRGGGVAGRWFQAWAMLLMWVPGAAALVRLRLRGLPLSTPGWRPRGWTTVLAALLVPPLADLGLASGLVLSGLARLPEQVAHVEGGAVLVAHGARLILGADPQRLWFFLLNLSLSVLVMSVLVAPLNAFLALGEELGWRGTLQPALTERWGAARGILATGLVWGLWHAPIIWMGYDFPAWPRLGALVLMPLLCVGMAGFLGWLYERSGSVLVPALAHGVGNASGGVLLTLVPASGDPLGIYLAMAALWLAVGGACLAALYRTNGTSALTSRR